MDLSPITIEDITLHSKYVNRLLTIYSDLIDEYRFDKIKQLILKENGGQRVHSNLNGLLYNYNKNNSNPIHAVNQFGHPTEDGSLTAWRYLIQAIISLDDPASVIENYNNANLDLSSYGRPFEYTTIDHCGLIKVQQTVPRLFNGITFECDVHIQAEVLGDDSLAHSNLAGHTLFIEEGCKKIGTEAISEISAKAIYLPSTIKELNYNCWYKWTLKEHPTINYNGTIQQLTNLMKKSKWKTMLTQSRPSSYPLISADIVCTDGKIPMGSKLDRNYNIID